MVASACQWLGVAMETASIVLVGEHLPHVGVGRRLLSRELLDHGLAPLASRLVDIAQRRDPAGRDFRILVDVIAAPPADSDDADIHPIVGAQHRPRREGQRRQNFPPPDVRHALLLSSHSITAASRPGRVR